MQIIVYIILILFALCLYKSLEQIKYDITFIIWFNIVIGIIYFGLSICFAYVDITKKPEYIYKLKIQKDTCLDIEEYKATFIRCIINYIFIIIPLLTFILVLLQYRYSKKPRVDLSSIVYLLTSILICYIIADFTAWFIHKGLHYFPWLWNNVHSKHHKHIAPVAVSAYDSHPIEIIFWNVLPFAIGPLLLGVNPAFFTTLSIIAIVNTLLCHSGYDLYYDYGHHDLHHERLKCNYSGALADIVMGTYLKREQNAIYPRFDSFQKDLNNSNNRSCDILENYTRVD